jgi:hypothetical protein
MAPLSSSSSLPVKVLLIIGLSTTTSTCAFTPPTSSRVDVLSSAFVQLTSSSSLRCRISRTHLSALRRSSDSSPQTQYDEDLFFAREYESQHNIENGDEYASYSQQMQEYSQQTDFQPQIEIPPSSSPPWQTNYASSSSAEEDISSASAPSNNNQEAISSVDARVLESILQEGKLDLSTEAEVKRLLEGPRRLEEENNRGEKDDKYNSKFVSVSSTESFPDNYYSYSVCSNALLLGIMWNYSFRNTRL